MICPNVRGVSEAFSNLAPRIWLGVGVLIRPPRLPEHARGVFVWLHLGCKVANGLPRYAFICPLTLPWPCGFPVFP